MRKYIDYFNECFVRNVKYVMSTNDMPTDPYYEHGRKQHMHGKPIKFGYKLWSVLTSRVYLIYFIPYQRSRTALLPDQEKLGLGALTEDIQVL